MTRERTSRPRFRTGPVAALGGIALGLGLSSGLAARRAGATDIETLVMPGPVIQGHAEIESNCGKCHQPFADRRQRELCLVCHEQVATDLHTKRGFHGRKPGLAQADCRSCHPEHRGRAFDAVGLDEQTLDHAHTDFALRGAHRDLACQVCHRAEDTFRDAPAECVACHREDDAHRGKLGKDCADCHRETAWAHAEFDHDSTGFPLLGRHVRVDCALCHPDERYEKTPRECVSCHRVTDAHRGRFGKKCETCHEPKGWDRPIFDHDRETEFPLEGLHQQARCEACHKGMLYKEELPTDCFSCHRLDDDHQGRNGTRCGDCHRPIGWSRSDFDHDRETDFPLRGAHREQACRNCHHGTLREEKMDTSCWACHSDDDVHRGQQGKACQSCHKENSWEDEVFFDHGLTRFPLLGLHATVSCEECHTAATFKDAPSFCNECHAVDDVHKRRLGTDCAYCHTPNGWPAWQFDHDTQTEFALHDAHAELNCHDCHTRPMRKRVRARKACGACHGRDDPHRGSFGSDCGRCHTERSWKGARPLR